MAEFIAFVGLLLPLLTASMQESFHLLAVPAS
jgi:hypothetical protein